MPTRGVVMRLGESPAGAPSALPSTEAVFHLQCTDDKEPRHSTLYFVPDIEPIVASSSPYDADLASSSGAVAWVVLSFVNGRDGAATSNSAAEHTPTTAPALGSIVVANGSTPRPEWEADYNAWYDEEHGGKLARVPGWQMMRRYRLARVYGEAETAAFYGVNFYDAENGLGGPIWKEGVTDWTLRIRDQAAKPNVRRTWRLVEV